MLMKKTLNKFTVTFSVRDVWFYGVKIQNWIALIVVSRQHAQRELFTVPPWREKHNSTIITRSLWKKMLLLICIDEDSEYLYVLKKSVRSQFLFRLKQSYFWFFVFTGCVLVSYLLLALKFMVQLICSSWTSDLTKSVKRSISTSPVKDTEI